MSGGDEQQHASRVLFPGLIFMRVGPSGECAPPSSRRPAGHERALLGWTNSFSLCRPFGEHSRDGVTPRAAEKETSSRHFFTFSAIRRRRKKAHKRSPTRPRKVAEPASVAGWGGRELCPRHGRMVARERALGAYLWIFTGTKLRCWVEGSGWRGGRSAVRVLHDTPSDKKPK